MKKILLGFSYLTWLICNLAIVYGIGVKSKSISELESTNEIVMRFTLGFVMLFFIVVLSIMILSIIGMMFGDYRLSDKLDKLKD